MVLGSASTGIEKVTVNNAWDLKGVYMHDVESIASSVVVVVCACTTGDGDSVRSAAAVVFVPMPSNEHNVWIAEESTHVCMKGKRIHVKTVVVWPFVFIIVLNIPVHSDRL